MVSKKCYENCVLFPSVFDNSLRTTNHVFISLVPIGPDGQQMELTEFEMFYLHNQLFSKVFRAFGWYEGTLARGGRAPGK